jgi:hypothetical protein
LENRERKGSKKERKRSSEIKRNRKKEKVKDREDR